MSVFKKTKARRNGMIEIESVSKGSCVGTGKKYFITEIQGGATYIGPSGHDDPIDYEVE